MTFDTAVNDLDLEAFNYYFLNIKLYGYVQKKLLIGLL